MKEEEIRPKKLFDEFIALAAKDVKTYFASAKYDYILCPACNKKGDFVFEKAGFKYEQCAHCLSIYVSPRPVASSFEKYYTESRSIAYWSETYYKATADARRKKLWKPKVRMIFEIVSKYMDPNSAAIVDIGGGYGLFAEEMRSQTGIIPIIIEPSPKLAAVCRGRNFTVVDKFVEDVQLNDLPIGQRVFVSFELFEHLHDPKKFVYHIRDLMNPGDLLIFTTLSGLGADITALWEDSKSISPPYHLNFFNPVSIELCLTDCGLQPLDISTPGLLDVDIIINNKEKLKDRFWKFFVELATEEQVVNMQAWLSANGWSSHMMVVCQKPKLNSF